MAAKKKALAAGSAAKAAKDSAYVQRLMHDEDLQDNLRQAYESARDAYGRLSDGKAPHKALFDDKKLQRDLRQAAESLRDATVALREAPKGGGSGGGGLFRKLLLLSVAGGLALALSESLRKKVLDALFGAEEEFEYTSTTAGSGTTGATTNAGSATAPAGSKS